MAGTITAAATIISAGATAYNTYQSWDRAQDAKTDAKKIQKARETQASDILEQIGNEELIYEDDLDMIRKQNALAEDKLKLQTASAFEQTGDTLENIVAGTYKSKYESGASERARTKARSAMKEEGKDILESMKMGQSEIALQNEDAERQAEIRYNQIIGSLEATYSELTGEDMPTNNPPQTVTPPALAGMSEEEIDDLYDEQAQSGDY